MKEEQKQQNIHQIYLKMGIVVSGTVDALERLLVDINGHKDIKMIYNLTSAYRLKIVEDKPQDYYPDEKKIIAK
jgi:hypothetical protein